MYAGHSLNLKIPREVFSSVLDEVGVLLQERAAQLLSENEAVRQFLEKTPVPPSMASQLPEDFRVFALLLNALKSMSGMHLAVPVFSKGYRPKQGKVAP